MATLTETKDWFLGKGDRHSVIEFMDKLIAEFGPDAKISDIPFVALVAEGIDQNWKGTESRFN